MDSIGLKEAQRLVMSSQKLMGPVLSSQQIIEHLGYVQIDTISVVERAHHHVFWSRNSKYRPSDLDVLVRQRKAFEYWSHAASFLPMTEYRYTLPMKRAFRKKETGWHPRDPKMMSAVLRRIKREGPLRSKDFENSKQGQTGWWDWKPAKKALERLFFEGKLEVSGRSGFQKVYDLPERVIPSSVDTSMPTDQEYFRFLVDRTLRHHGLATIDEIGYLAKKETKQKITKTVQAMLSDKELVEVQVGDLSKRYFAYPESLNQLPRAHSKILILSPFDNLVIQRQKMKDLFHYDYQIECYVPAKKRKFGYFCLPIFKGCQPVGRMDCKVDRSIETLKIQSLHYESSIDKNTVKKGLASQLKRFAKFNHCKSIQADSSLTEYL